MNFFCPFGQFSHAFAVYLADSAVIAQKAVGLILHVGELSQHRGTEPLGQKGKDLFIVKACQSGAEGLFLLEKAIAVGILFVKAVPGGLIGISAEFGELPSDGSS